MALFAKKDAPLRVDLPPPAADRALTGKVGIVAVVGFAIGVAWPRLLDFKPGPDVPHGSGVTATSASRPGVPLPSAAGSAAPAPADSAAPGPAESGDAQSPTNKQQVVVGDGAVTGCKGKKGKIDDCGKVSFDKTAKSRLAELARCPAAIGLEGKMTLGLTLNFEKNEVVVDGERKKSTLPSATVTGVIACAGQQLKGVELEKVPHTHLRYSLAYELSFYPPGKSPPEPNADGAEAPEGEGEGGLGRATITYERANVRDNPGEGKIVFKLAQGSKVKLLEEKDNWYKIESGKGKGWVYRQAIGK